MTREDYLQKILQNDDVDNLRRAISYLERVTTIPKGSTAQADGAGSGGH